MSKTHAVTTNHKKSYSNPGENDSNISDKTLAYRTAACGQTLYCKLETEIGFSDQFGPIPFVKVSEHVLVTCKACKKICYGNNTI